MARGAALDAVENPIYLDYQATTPVDPRVLEAILPFFAEDFGNPSSGHAHGHRAAAAVTAARESVLTAVGGRRGDKVVFTSGATESVYLAILGAALAHADRGDHVVTTAIEHKAVLAACEALAGRGLRVTVLPVDGDGSVHPEQVREALTPRTVLGSIMYANNEIGTVQEMAEIGEVLHTAGVLFHTDATQALATLPVDAHTCHIDLLSFSGHKMYGPKGVGGLYIGKGVRISPLQGGGGQEYGLRGGTLNVPGIVGLGAAAVFAGLEAEKDALRVGALRDRLQRRLLTSISGLRVNGSLARRLPGNLSVTIPGVEATALLRALPSLAMSTGSACATGRPDPSHVLLAIGLSRQAARSTLRVSLGRHSTDEDVDRAGRLIVDQVERLRAGTPMIG